MRKIPFCAVLTVLLAVLLSAAASATSYGSVDMEYSGVLGSYYEEDTPESAGKNTRISITPTISYSGEERLFYYSVADIATPFTSNVMDGMITAQPVTVTAPVGIACELYRDGDLSQEPLTEVKKAGSYVLRVKSNDGVTVPVLSFTVLNGSTGSMTGYTMPEGFSVTEQLFNGSTVSFREDYADLSRDGDYKVTYRCAATGVVYSLSVSADHTAPELKLEAVTDGKAWGPVDLSDAEKGSTVTVYRNGEEEPFARELTKSGQYELVISDAAGNKTSYAFTIMIYFNSGTLFFFIAVAVILAGVAAYILIARKKLRVR